MEQDKNKKGKSWGIKDYYDIWVLSLRSFFWRSDGHQTGDKVANQFDSFFFVYWIVKGWPIFCLLCFLAALKGGNINLIVSPVFLSCFIVPLTCDLKRLKYNLHYKSSVWYTNTGITPSEVVHDKGTYGEYIATLGAERHLENNHIYGKVFNSVIVPKRVSGGKDTFTEIDVLSVNETGIHVMEVKNRNGRIQGGMQDKYWELRTGRGAERIYNPFLQNLGHINYLHEYLYDSLSDNSTLKQRNLVDTFKNLLLIAALGLTDNLNHHGMLTGSYFAMPTSTLKHEGYDKFDSVKIWGKIFSKEEVDEICAIVEKLQVDSEEEKKRLVEEREYREQRGEFRESPDYYIARIEYMEDGQLKISDAICRDTVEYKTFCDTRDSQYKAMPGARIIARSEITKDEQEIIDYYNNNCI